MVAVGHADRDPHRPGRRLPHRQPDRHRRGARRRGAAAVPRLRRRCSSSALVPPSRAVVVRFRRSRGAERQQMKWFLFAVGAAAPAAAGDVLPEWLGGLPLLLALFGAADRHRDRGAALPARRHRRRHQPHARLRRADRPGRRRLRARRRLPRGSAAPRGRPADLAGRHRHRRRPVRARCATGCSAAVDRLLYGQRAEPYAALSRLGERLEGTLAPDAVLPAIVTTVRESLRLPYAAIALDDDEPGRRVRASRCPRTVRFPLLYRSEPVGDARPRPAPGRGRLLPRRPPAARPTWPGRPGSPSRRSG